MKRGIFTIDPGKSTGVTWGIYDLRSKTIADAMKNRAKTGSTTVIGDPQTQAEKLWKLWADFVKVCEGQRLASNGGFAECIIEEYVIRVGHAPGTKDTISIRVAWAFCGYAHAKNNGMRFWTFFQLPSDAMRFNNQKMLRPWGAWIVGKEHERAAFAHAGLRLMKIGLN